MNKVYALKEDGTMSLCSVPADSRGKGNCPHIGHQSKDETVEDFVKRTQVYSWESHEQWLQRMEDYNHKNPSNYNNDTLNREYNRKAYWELKEKLDK